MINNTFELLWRDISPFSVGFDRTIDTLSLLANSKQTSNYPPYNIRKISEEQYTIGSKAKDASEGIVHQGLAARDFVKKFVLSDDMVIKGAALNNGMLYIGLERVIPEDQKPRKISFTSKS